MSRKKKILTALIAFLLVGAILAVVLLGIFFGTGNHKNGIDYFEDYFEIPIEKLPESEQVIVDRTDSYLGHPDLVVNDAGEMITMYPLSHGKGQLAMKTSSDAGRTWSERVTEIPASWTNSRETPTLYNLKFLDGKTVLIMISGCPDWGGEFPPNGFNCSVSTDGGKNWSEFANFYGIEWGSANNKPAFTGIVAMSSLTQVKENGAFVDRWLGTFHDGSFTNYRTYLTFRSDGTLEWSEPEKLLAPWREIELYSAICEIEIIRTPAPQDGTLILLARANTHITRSMMAFSDDEGLTWTEPKEAPYCLTGERHKAEYNPETGKLAISFRSFQEEQLSALSDKRTKRTAGWVAWIGTFADILSLRDNDTSNDRFGEKALVLGTDYSYTGDCGYAGTALDADGNYVMISYGRFRKGAEFPFIMSVRFRA